MWMSQLEIYLAYVPIRHYSHPTYARSYWAKLTKSNQIWSSHYPRNLCTAPTSSLTQAPIVFKSFQCEDECKIWIVLNSTAIYLQWNVNIIIITWREKISSWVLSVISQLVMRPKYRHWRLFPSNFTFATRRLILEILTTSLEHKIVLVL